MQLSLHRMVFHQQWKSYFQIETVWPTYLCVKLIMKKNSTLQSLKKAPSTLFDGEKSLMFDVDIIVMQGYVIHVVECEAMEK